jgi:4-hydroxy-tetrahydrodipicolinate reductase
MRTIILGDGAMGQALADAVQAAAWPEPCLLGRPGAVGHPSEAFRDVEVAFEVSRSEAVASNVAAALQGGMRAIVIGTTGWGTDRVRVEELLATYGASAVEASNFSLGVALFARLVETAARSYGALPAFDPYIVEWHRRTKVDQPSGTAKELARRLIAAHPRKTRPVEANRPHPPDPDELEIGVVRAGASPGMHLVGFDAPGESVELRITARDRSAYAAGAIEAADWLLRRPRPAGLHPFERVVDELLSPVPAIS